MTTKDIRQLKIIVASTPKTGNTWVRSLLSTMYSLPTVQLDEVFDPKQADAYGPCWVAQQHFLPAPALVEWVKEKQAIIVTTMRHPGDTLLSLHSYIRRTANDPATYKGLVRVMTLDRQPFGPNFEEYVQDNFCYYLNISIAWLRQGCIPVRYEDMWRDPETTLQHLTERIGITDPSRIGRVIEMCDIDVLRNITRGGSMFFGQGQINQWQHKLPPNIIEILKHRDPYPAQFKALGYTMDPDDPLLMEPRKPRGYLSPFRNVNQFDNGVAVTPFLANLYLSLPPKLTDGWNAVADTHSPNSFWAWLMRPADDDPINPAGLPIITNLAACLHQLHGDLRQTFPDLYTRHRVEYARWLIGHMKNRFGLDNQLLATTWDSLRSWANARAVDADLLGTDPEPFVSNIALYIYRLRSDLQQLFPTLANHHRVTYLHWFLHWAQNDFDLDVELVAPVREAFERWAHVRSPRDRQWREGMPYISNYAAYLHDAWPGPRQLFHDPFDSQRDEFIQWYNAQTHLELFKPLLRVPSHPNFEQWANAPAEEDPHPPGTVPILTNLAVAIYRSRPDVQSEYPDLFGAHRIGFLVWLVERGKIGHEIDNTYMHPIMAAWAQAST